MKLIVAVNHALQPQNNKRGPKKFNNPSTSKSNNGVEWVDLTQMTIISTIVGRNSTKEMEWPSWSTKESEMQYLDAISKTTEWSLFVSKANHSTSQ